MTTGLRETLAPLPLTVNPSRLLVPRRLGGDEAPGTQRASARRDPAALAITLERPGPCPPGGVTVFIVLDESASVAASGGNDPLARRHAETALAIRHVASTCRCRADQVGLVPFDHGSRGFVAPQALNAAGVRRLTRGLERLSSGYGISSELDPPLKFVETHAGHQRGSVAMVVFSDFLITDANPSGVIARLRTFPGYLHAVVLGALPPSVLAADPNVTVTRLTPSSPPGEAARAVFDGLNHYRRHGHVVTGGIAHKPPTAERSSSYDYHRRRPS